MAIREHQIMGDVGQIVPMRFHPKYYETLKDICSRSNIVVNAAGRDFDKYGDTMELANITFAENLAKACAETGVERFFHISCNGADETSPSVYFKTKAKGEQVVKKHYPKVTIMRPTTIFGAEDKFLNFYAKCLRVSGVPMINRGQSLVQPVHVGDVARSISACLSDPFLSFQGKTFHLSGEKIYKHNEISKSIADIIEEPHSKLPLLRPLAFLFGFANEFTWKPTFTRDFVIRLQYDNVLPSEEILGFKELSIIPEKMEDSIEFIVARFKRHSGYFLNAKNKL
jgi:NADH dehydrogenase (ubiquinone) 1 alpha subcomplex subunit 9